ncbi:hypothetical protein IE53DRAFT_11842 [Violaceomyces palustris]|uniref:Uncharacterized protein n=1 Tax=Violaceomyces palustris TaxID=1673888 RepID=A0ACD0P298_9BASI|nr:hypothetical protein IE53DRAFT_11842 [Violaceomyces palustris]
MESAGVETRRKGKTTNDSVKAESGGGGLDEPVIFSVGIQLWGLVQAPFIFLSFLLALYLSPLFLPFPGPNHSRLSCEPRRREAVEVTVPRLGGPVCRVDRGALPPFQPLTTSIPKPLPSPNPFSFPLLFIEPISRATSKG